MDCGVYYHEAQSGKSKRENRENNGHLVRKTLTPNKQSKHFANHVAKFAKFCQISKISAR